MEVFNPSQIHVGNYRSVFNQNGGTDMDLYVYNQDGEGIGSFFGKLGRVAIPLIGKAIKGAARIVTPHAKRAASDVITAGSKSLLSKVSNKAIHKPHSRKRKWRNL